jgi:hypothetical protein
MKIIGVAVLALVVAIPSVAFAQDDNRAAGGIGGALPGARRRAVQQQCAMVAESVPWCVIVIAHGPILPDEFLIAERVVEAEAVLMSPRRSPCPFTRVVSVREAPQVDQAFASKGCRTDRRKHIGRRPASGRRLDSQCSDRPATKMAFQSKRAPHRDRHRNTLLSLSSAESSEPREIHPYD